MTKIVVYTCIIGNYDDLKEVKNVEKNIDYICFTNLPLESNTWKIIQISNELNLDDRRFSRHPKIMPHLFLSDYDISIYVDGSFIVVGKFNNFLFNTLKGHNYYVPKHPIRSCIYQEGDEIKKLKFDSNSIVDEQLNKYKSEGFPENFGLTQNGFLIRRHNKKDCINVSEQWWNEILNHSKRDQLSFMYVTWKNPQFKYETLYSNIMYDGKHIKLKPHK